jgi:hypothetical protein
MYLIIIEINTVAYLSVMYNIIKQFPTWNIFHHHKNIRWCFNDFIPDIKGVEKGGSVKKEREVCR